MEASDSYCPHCQADDHEVGAKICTYDGTPLRAKRDRGSEWIGQVVDGKYRVLRFVDAGGTAEVYEVERLGSATQRRLALKLLHKTLSGDSDLLQQFRQEARLVSLIAHPNVVAIQDFGTLPGDVHYMVMELLDGRSLAAELDGRPMAPLRALRFAMQACEGLAAAHQREVLHCDIKPHNFFLQAEPEGEPTLKILDLGIGRFAHAETGGGRIAGTPDYMSPEQCRGLHLGQAADIYSMGVVLYEMLLGRMPFAADSPMEILEMHVSVPAAWPQELAASLGVPAQAEAVVMKALSKEPADRQASMIDLQQELSALTRQLRAVGASAPSMRPRTSKMPSAGPPPSATPSVSPRARNSAAPQGGVRETRAEGERPRGSIVEVERDAATGREATSARASAPAGRTDPQGQAVILEIWEGMLVLAFDGSLDAMRGAAMAARVRGEIERRRAHSLLIDASALPNVDAVTLEQLRFLAAATGRPGVYCVLTGLRGLDQSRAESDGLPMFRTLVDGIAACMRERELRR
jgi:serine/threonine protein kinase/anti-anti-sigma regulatory factor